MCGIVGFTGQDNALPILLKGLYLSLIHIYTSSRVIASSPMVAARVSRPTGPPL